MRPTEPLDVARSSFAERRWRTAYEAFDQAAEAGSISAADLDRQAECAHLLHRLDDYYTARERAFHRHLDDGDTSGAALSAFWTGMQHTVDGDHTAGGGWLQRAVRVAESADDPDGRVLGYLALARSFQARAARDWDQALALIEAAVAAGLAHRDPDLSALGLHWLGIFLIGEGRIAEGRAALDEAMVAVVGEETTPMVTGIVYCGAVTCCWDVYDLDRAHRWTDSLTQWCESAPELETFVGECRVRRAELAQLHGEWDRARAELVGLEDDVDAGAVALALEVRGQLDRVQGRFDDAERSFAAAARLGREPQPGLALLRLARGSSQAAAAMMRRSIAEVRAPGRRMAVLAAAVEIFLAVDDGGAAATATAEAGALAQRYPSPVAAALAAGARARLALAEGRAQEAVAPARESLETWCRLVAPYEEARSRVLLSAAYTDLDDAESGSRELATARDIFAALGAKPDLGSRAGAGRHGLSPREVEVLQLVATGATNRAVAAELVVSERTVDRHVSSILTKLGVANRAAATARAAELGLI